MRTFEVWAEGYSTNGDSGIHRLMGTEDAETFQEACDIVFSNSDESEYWRECYNAERLTHWGCRLFDNATEARKALG